MSSYRIDELSVDQLDRISLPKFQRGFVWTKKKQEDFVQTLHDGYPFGTLLVYPENDNDKDAKLQLLDGQQRLSTIKKYRQDPLQFWKRKQDPIMLSGFLFYYYQNNSFCRNH